MIIGRVILVVSSSCLFVVSPLFVINQHVRRKGKQPVSGFDERRTKKIKHNKKKLRGIQILR